MNEKYEVRLGGRDAATIADTYPWQSPYELWLIKTQRIPKPAPANDAIWMGNVMESPIAERFAEERGLKLLRDNRLLRHREHPHLVGRIDRRIVGAGYTGGVEVKAVNGTDWGESGTDEVPPYVLLQCAHYLLITGWDRWYVAAALFFPYGREFRWYEIPRDDELLAMLLEREQEFYSRVIEDRAPPTENPADLRLRYPTSTERVYVANEDIALAVAQLASVHKAIADAQSVEKALQAEIMEAMGDAATLLVHPDDARPLVTWKSHERKGYVVKPTTVRPFKLIVPSKEVITT